MIDLPDASPETEDECIKQEIEKGFISVYLIKSFCFAIITFLHQILLELQRE